MCLASTVIYTILFFQQVAILFFQQVVQPVQSVTSTLTSQTLSSNGSPGICPAPQDLDAAVQSINEVASNIAQRLRLLPQCAGGGYWYEVLDFDVNASNSTCPSGLTLSSEPEGCGGEEGPTGCSIGLLPIDGIEYSRVCGRITGRTLGTADGFATSNDDVLILVEETLELIWGFYSSSDDPPNCPCAGGNDTLPFLGDNYFCDSSMPNDTRALWTGENCGTDICCSFNSPPYFTTDLSAPITRSIIAVVCRLTGNTVIESMQLFVQ